MGRLNQRLEIAYRTVRCRILDHRSEDVAPIENGFALVEKYDLDTERLSPGLNQFNSLWMT